MIRNRFYALIILSIFGSTAFCQTNVKPQVLSKTEWLGYFTRHFQLKKPEAIKTEVVTNEIPYPSVWKYSGDNKDMKDKYRLYAVGGNGDYMTMPSNNGVGTYLFYFDNKNPDKDFMEMNFVADSISCKKLSKEVFMFQFNDDGFKIKGDSSGFKRYIFVSNQGRIGTKSIVAHGCTITINSIDTVHSVIYLNVVYAKHPSCAKCFRFDYKNFLLLSDLDDVEDLNGTIVIDAVHYCFIKKVEEASN
jgi:hypothetical protein